MTMTLLTIEKTLRSHPFVTSKFLQNRHLQSLFPKLIPSFKTTLPPYERKFIKLPDGSQLAADCLWQQDKNKHTTIVLVGGITGYRNLRRSRSVMMTSYKAYHFGYNVIHLKQRAEGDTVHLTKSIVYNVHDLPIAFAQLKAWGLKKMFVIGVSAGAYTLLYGLGAMGRKAHDYLLGAVAISAPTRMLETWAHVEQSPLYDKMLLATYKQMIKRRVKIDPPGTWDVKQLTAIKTKREWGEQYMHLWESTGTFSTLEQFDKQFDAAAKLPKIRIPTLIIHAYDDPISPIKPFITTRSPYLITLLTKHGGHGGFIATKKLYGDLDGHWAQNRALEFIRLLEKER